MNSIFSVLKFGKESVENGLRDLFVKAFTQLGNLVIEISDLGALMAGLLLLLVLRSEIDTHQVELYLELSEQRVIG